MASVIDKAVGYNAIATCMDSDPDLSMYVEERGFYALISAGADVLNELLALRAFVQESAFFLTAKK